MSAKIPDEVLAELEATGLPWAVDNGSRHAKLRLCGRLVGILPRGRASFPHPKATLNTITQIRRMARALKEGRDGD